MHWIKAALCDREPVAVVAIARLLVGTLAVARIREDLG